MFSRNSKPWTRRQNIWFGVYCAACIAIVALIIAYNAWAEASIRWSFGDAIDIRHVSAIKLNCSPEHFWGHHIRYRDDDTGVPGDIYMHTGYVCRDWARGGWILVGDVDWQKK
jgi:hypothetical protein